VGIKELQPELHKEKTCVTQNDREKKKAGERGKKELARDVSKPKSIFSDDVSSDNSDDQELAKDLDDQDCEDDPKEQDVIGETNENHTSDEKLIDSPQDQEQEDDIQIVEKSTIHAEPDEVPKQENPTKSSSKIPLSKRDVSRQIFPARKSSPVTLRDADPNILCENCLNCQCRKKRSPGN